MLSVGQRVELTIDDVAHGGTFIARHDGAVVFVRGTDIGEKVLAEITKVGPKGRSFFAEVEEILTASGNRVVAPCVYAGICGGCDFQHLEIQHQRDLKKRVILNSLAKFAAIDESMWAHLEVQALSEFHYRTRMRYQRIPNDDFGLFQAETHSIVLIDECKIAREEISIPRDEIGVVAKSFQGFTSLASPKQITESVGDYSYRLDSNSFWQSHKDSPERFLDIVFRLANLHPGETVWDLYAGVGLFTLPSATYVGPEGRVFSVEGDKNSARYLHENSQHLKHVKTFRDSVDAWLLQEQGGVDVVILDPPRKGAGREVITSIISKKPRAIVYVACDPVALARDVGYARGLGYELAELEAVDAYPQTYHVETFALLIQARIDEEEIA